MDFLFYLFIYPIEWLMLHILESVFSFTGNYGISIIILSVAINAIVTPLYYLADYFRDEHQRELTSLQPKIDLINSTYKGHKRHYYLQALYRVNNYHSLGRIKASIGLLLQIPFFFAAFHFIGNYDYFAGHSFGVIEDLGRPDGLAFGQNFLPIAMTLISLSTSYIYSKNMGSGDRWQLWGISIVFLVLLYYESAALLLYWTINNLFSSARIWLDNKYNIAKFKQMMVNLLLIPARALCGNKMVIFITKDVYSQSIILLLGTIFLYQAIPIAASDIRMYAADYAWVVATLLGYFLLSVVIATFLYIRLSRNMQRNVLKLLTFAALSGVFYSFLSPFYIEKLTSLSLPDFRIHEWPSIKLIKLSVVAALLAFWIFAYKRIKNVVWAALLLSNIILSANALSKGMSPQATGEEIVVNNSNMSLKQANEFYSFSKDSNTIVIMLDMFQGNIFQDIVNKHPGIKKDLSGFVYYPNTLSHGSTTWTSMSSLIGGADFQVQHIKELNSYRELEATTKNKFYTPKNISYLHNKLMADRYDTSYSIFNPSYVDCNLLDSYDDLICTRGVILDHKLERERDEIASAINIQSSTEVANFFTKLSFVMSIPHELKGRVARYIKGGPIFDEYVFQISQYSQLRNMVDFSNADSEKKTLKFIDNKFTHVTWMANDNCQVVNQEFEGYRGLFNAGFCSVKLLISFFEKLKKLGIYDNTKIIIVSDHGMDGIMSQNKKMSIKDPKASALMLVKDFDESGDFRVSKKFLSNMDTYGIALSGVSRNKEISLDKIKTHDTSRRLLYIKEVIPWTSYNITEAFEVKENVFDQENWKKLNADEISKLNQ